MTQEGALAGDEVALHMAFSRIVTGETDPHGRMLIFDDPSRLEVEETTRESLVRSIWYVLHAVLESEATQKRGIIFMSTPRVKREGQFDIQFQIMLVNSLKNSVPLRLSGIFICYPPLYFKWMWNTVRPLIPKRLLLRVQVWRGTEEEVLANLAEYGLTAEKVPKELGGEKELDSEKWLKERKEAGL